MNKEGNKIELCEPVDGMFTAMNGKTRVDREYIQKMPTASRHRYFMVQLFYIHWCRAENPYAALACNSRAAWLDLGGI